MLFYYLNVRSMKYILSLFLMTTCFLWWCHHQSQPYWTWYSSNTNIWITNPWVGMYSQTTWGTLMKNFALKWRHITIEFSWHLLTYSGIFSINIPDHLDTRSYEEFVPENLTSENLVFSERTHTYYVGVFSSDRNLIKTAMTDKEVCLLQTEYTGVKNIARDTTTKMFTNKNIFITKVTMPNPWNHEPYLYSTHICFFYSTNIYDIIMDTYHFSDIQQSINSFNFIY